VLPIKIAIITIQIDNLKTAKAKAEESDRLKTAFLQNMSHEIRTPMNAIMGFSELLVKNFNNKPKLEKFSEIVNQRCNDLLDIVNDILDIAKIESGQLTIYSEECKLKSLFEELTLFFKEQVKTSDKQHIKFSLQVLCEPSDLVIVIDKIKLKQILINLISNAFKFTETGAIEGGCKFDENQNLIFFVSDTGIGIPKEKQQVIFERFVQLEQSPNRLYGGTGLGLSIVKGLVDLLGGKLTLESEIGIGSVFYVTIPCNIIRVSSSEPSETEKVETYNFPNKTILIVEDDLYNAAYLAEVLNGNHLNILHTIYGKEAVKISTSQNVDLVLMDIRLPDIDGYDATRQIRAMKPKLKIIAQTAYAAYDEKQKALDAGCNDYISKPTKQSDLLKMLNRHLS
jgi:CheY-like chemotaxis protein